MKTVKPSTAHRRFRDGMIAVMREHQELSSMEMLALASHFVGQLVALQDQRRVTPSMAMELVARNIEEGNQSAIGDLMNPGGQA